MTPPAAALSADNLPRPRHWERLVLFAYLRMMGSTQKDAGSAVGRSRRTAQSWEEDDKRLYTQARDEARQRWRNELTDAARQTLLRTIRDGHGELALKVLERTDRDLAPPTQRLQHSHEVGEGLSALLKTFGGDDARPG